MRKLYSYYEPTMISFVFVLLTFLGMAVLKGCNSPAPGQTGGVNVVQAAEDGGVKVPYWKDFQDLITRMETVEARTETNYDKAADNEGEIGILRKELEMLQGNYVDLRDYTVRLERRLEALENQPPPDPDDPDNPDDPDPTFPVESRYDMWISKAELAKLPTTGAAWEQLKEDAYQSDWGTVDLSNQHHPHNTNTLAGALVAARLGDEELAARVRGEILKIPETENGGRSLALARNLMAYLVAASLVGFEDDDFDRWLDAVRREDLSGKTLIFTHEDRPNNWGTHAGASRIAAAIWLNDQEDLQRAAAVFKGWLGDRDSYADFDFKSPHEEWQADPDNPVAVNPKGAVRHGNDFDGILPDDLRRGGGYTWPPNETGYVWSALNGVVLQAELLHRQGYDAWKWEDEAVRRAVAWQYRRDWDVQGEDEEWLVHLVNARYGTDFAVPTPARVGKPFGYTDWLSQ